MADLRAARAFTMPKWGIEMLEGTISQWCVEDGHAFKKGDVLALIETDKISNEVEAEFDGMLARRLAAVGDTLPVGALLAVLGAGGSITSQEVDTFISRHRGRAPEESSPDDVRTSSEAERCPPQSWRKKQKWPLASSRVGLSGARPDARRRERTRRRSLRPRAAVQTAREQFAIRSVLIVPRMAPLWVHPEP